jgi:DNA-binding MarR family transcriptional regulator
VGVDVEAFAREFPGLNPFANQAVRNLIRLADVVTDRINVRLKVHGLHLASAQALAVLEGAPGPLTPNEITAHLHLTSGTVTTLLDGLERRGLVRRDQHPDDRRKVLVSITAEGRALVDAYLPETVAIQTALLGVLTDDELHQLNDSLQAALTAAAGVDPHAAADAAPARHSGRRR